MNWMREISGRRTLIISDTFVILTDVSCGLRTKAFEMDISMSDLVCITLQYFQSVVLFLELNILVLCRA